MKTLIIIEYIINLILMLIYHMHMFQLNSYSFQKHIRWFKQNILRTFINLVLIAVSTCIYAINYNKIFVIIILAISIIYNIPKEKSKIPLKITNRVKRLFITELIISLLIINNINIYLIIKLAILNIISPILGILSNFINTPIETLIKKKYINEAKDRLKQMPNLIVIGVTGSYGKTSVKNYLYKTLSPKYEVLITPKNYNTTMGIVKTIRENLKPIHQIFICEMGATNPNDIKEICDIVKPTIGIITSIGPQHLESFKTIENVIKTKFELADSVKSNNGIMFLNYDNEYISNQKIDMNFYSYGINNNQLDFNSYNLISSSKGLSFTLSSFKSSDVEFKSRIIGKHNIVNLTVAIAVAEYLGISPVSLVPIIKNIKNVEHRLELINHGNLNIIDDSYNSNPISSKSAIETLSEFEGTKIIITPGLIELGKDEYKYNFELGKFASTICDYIYLVGSHSQSVLDGVRSQNFDNNKIFIVDSPNSAMEQIFKLNINGNITILLENDLPDNYN